MFPWYLSRQLLMMSPLAVTADSVVCAAFWETQHRPSRGSGRAALNVLLFLVSCRGVQTLRHIRPTHTHTHTHTHVYIPPPHTHTHTPSPQTHTQPPHTHNLPPAFSTHHRIPAVPSSCRSSKTKITLPEDEALGSGSLSNMEGVQQAGCHEEQGFQHGAVVRGFSGYTKCIRTLRNHLAFYCVT